MAKVDKAGGIDSIGADQRQRGTHACRMGERGVRLTLGGACTGDTDQSWTCADARSSVLQQGARTSRARVAHHPAHATQARHASVTEKRRTRRKKCAGVPRPQARDSGATSEAPVKGAQTRNFFGRRQPLRHGANPRRHAKTPSPHPHKHPQPLNSQALAHLRACAHAPDSLFNSPPPSQRTSRCPGRRP